MSHIEDLVQCLGKHTTDPHCLPPTSEQVIKDIKGIDFSSIVAFKVIQPVKIEHRDYVFFSCDLDSTVIAWLVELPQIQCLFHQQYR